MMKRSALVMAVGFSVGVVGCGGGDSDASGGQSGGIGTLWIANEDTGSLRKVDSAKGDWEVVTMPSATTYIAFGAGAVWTVGEAEPKIYRVDPSSNEVVATIDAVGPLRGIAADDSAVWVLEDATGGATHPPRVLRVDPATNSIVATIDVADINDQFDGIAMGEGTPYVAIGNGFAAVKIDPATNKVANSEPLGQAGGYGYGRIGYADGRLWIVDQSSDILHELDPSNVKALHSYDIKDEWAGFMAVGSKYVFIAYGDADQLIAIDANTGALAKEIDVKGKARYLTRAKGKIICGLIDTDGGDIVLLDETSGAIDKVIPGVYGDNVAVQ